MKDMLLLLILLCIAASTSCIEHNNYALDMFKITNESISGDVSRSSAIQNKKEFVYPDDDKVIIFTMMRNYSQKYKIRTTVYSPDGQVYFNNERNQDQHKLNSSAMNLSSGMKQYRGYYLTETLDLSEMSSRPGEWKVEVFVNGELTKTDTFAVSSREPSSGLVSQVKSTPKKTRVDLEPSQQPMLVLNPGLHYGLIYKIGIDASGKYIVTGSADKTVRIWDAQGFRQLHVLRPPIGEEKEGRIYAVAISPDGKTVACGGWTGKTWAESYCIYLFERETGRLTTKIDGLPDATQHLVYSKDGRYLAAVLSSRGVRVFRTSDCKMVGKDDAYDAESDGADFDTNNRLVTTSYDGYVRLYSCRQDGLHLLIRQRPSKGTHPFSATFSPDGSRIAISFTNSSSIEVVSGDSLAHIFSPTPPASDNVERIDHLYAIAWSNDGEKLYASGRFYLRNIDNPQPIFCWDKRGQGAGTILHAQKDTTRHIVQNPAGGIVYCGFDGWGVIDAAGRTLFQQSPSDAIPRSYYNKLLISSDATKVRCSFDLAGNEHALFDISSRMIRLGPINANPLVAALTSHGALEVKNWRDNMKPTLDGRPIGLSVRERSRSLAILPDGSGFVLGTEWNVRLIDRHGKLLWKRWVPSIAYELNLSADGRIIVAGLGDGTVRWYRLQDGTELLAMIVHSDRKRWVAWTPSGYYDAAPGAEELIGWHVNNGPDHEADFFPISKFRDAYYRPDVIAQVIPALGDEKALAAVGSAIPPAQSPAVQASPPKQATVAASVVKAPSAAGPVAKSSPSAASVSSAIDPPAAVAGLSAPVAPVALPPVTRIVSPAGDAEVSSPEVAVRYSLRSPTGEPLTGVRALVEGRTFTHVSWGDAAGLREFDGEIRVAIPERDCEVSIIGENKVGTSEPSTVRLRFKGAAAAEVGLKPKLYILAVGISKYETRELLLDFAAKDAADFAETMKRQRGALYREVEIRLLTDGSATKDAVLDGLEWVRKQTTSRDVAMVFMAGHGVNDMNGVYYYLPVNVHPDSLLRTGVPYTDIKNAMTSIAGKALLFLDTCHSGNILGKSRGFQDLNKLVNELVSAESGLVVFAASTGAQQSVEDAAWGNGAFTKALVEGMSGRAAYGGAGKVTINMLDLYVSERVKELTRGSQTPTSARPQTIPDFPLAIVAR